MDIRLSGYKNRNGQNGGFNLALHAIYQMNMDLGFIFKTTIMGGVYKHCSSECNMLASGYPSKHQGWGGGSIFF